MTDTARKVAESCFDHGVVMYDYSSGAAVEVHAPITLQPLPLSPSAFNELESLMPLWNQMIDRVARDPDFLVTTLRGSDAEFTERLVDIFERTYRKDPSEWGQRLMLGVFRSDYLISDQQAQAVVETDGVVVSDAVGVGAIGHPFRQVEINTISCAFPALSTRTGLVHRDALDELLGKETNVYVSPSEQRVVEGLAMAHAEWISRCGNKSGIVVFLVQDGERNAGDQRILAEGLKARGVDCVRRTLSDLARDMTIAVDRTASVLNDEGQRAAISLFYLRSLYDVKDFKSEEAWKAREAMEICNAVKCPSLPYHLCTWKRVQQALASYATLRRFCDTDDTAKRLHHCMVKQFLLTSTDSATEAAIADAIETPSKYVMKTQREGTGSLIVGEQLKGMLATPKTDPEYHRIRSEHLLMERIVARRRPGRVLRKNEVHYVADLECEVGTFGTILSDGGAPLLNSYAGYLVRSKSGSTEGGGVMSGVAALDSIAISQNGATA